VDAKLLYETLRWIVFHCDRIVPMPIGPAGAGKSEIIGQVAQDYHALNPCPIGDDLFSRRRIPFYQQDSLIRQAAESLMKDVMKGVSHKELTRRLRELTRNHIDPVILARQGAKHRWRTEILDVIEGHRKDGWSLKKNIIQERLETWSMDYLDPLLEEVKRRQHLPLLLPPFTVPGLIALHLGAQGDVGDLIGLPQTFAGLEVDGNVSTRTAWSKPMWFPNERWGNVVVHLEELNRVNAELRTAGLQILADFMVHVHRFPPTVKLAASGNPPTEDYEVQEMDRALSDRVCFLKYTPTVRGFIEYASEIGAHTEMLGFLNDHPEHLIPPDGSFELKMEPSPRTWMKVNHLERVNLQHPAPEGVLDEVILGSVGPDAGAVYIRYKKEGTDKVLRPEDIFERSSYPHDELQAQLGKPDKVWFTTTMVAKYLYQRQPADETPGMAKRFDRFVGDLTDDQAYNLCFELSQQDHAGSLGYTLLSNRHCRNAMKVMERVIESAEEYDVTAKAA